MNPIILTEAPLRVLRVLWIQSILGITCLSGSSTTAADSFVQDAEERQRIAQALPAKATVQPAKPRRLLIFTRNVGYGGHKSIAHASEAFTLLGKKNGAFETTVSADPAVFERESLKQFDAVFLNNTIGIGFTNARLRQNLLEFVTGGGGLMGVHGTSIAFMHWQWPPVEDWPEFGNLIGTRGAFHRDANERAWIKIDDADHPLNRVFAGRGFEMSDEFFRFHEPYSRERVRVLLSMDTAKTDLSGIKPGDPVLRKDNDYAFAWVRNYGRGRVFYTTFGHNAHVFWDARMLPFFLDAAQFVLGDLPAPTTPSAKLSPAVLAQEKLGWRLGVEAYTFHKFTFFETIEKTAELGLPYIGGLSFMQQVSKDIAKNFDQNLTDDELRQIRLKLDSAGVRLLTYYAQDIPGDEPGCRKLFEFGRKLGFETFMCEPKPEQLDLLDKFANEYGINVAIHNHGQNISPHYWRPAGVLKACEGRSKRIGAAPDLGYWLRSGIDPVEAVRLLKDRIITVQMHDLHEPGSNGHDVPWGTGIGKSAEFFRELHRQGIKPTMIGLEYSHDWFESMPKIAKCIEFFNATTLQLAAETQAKSFSDPDKIDVLVVTGGHHFDPEPFFDMFKGCDDIKYVEHSVKDESEVFEDVSAWNYDVVLLYNMTQKISPKRQDNFVRLLKDKGVGVVVVHHAEAAFQSWPEFHQIIGTAYIYFDVEVEGKLWPHCKCKGGQNIAVAIRDDQHPITRGMKDFTIHDETYKGRWWAEGNHVLLTTDHPDNDEPVAWTRQYGRSRVFNIQFGHDKQAYACPEYRDLLVRGIRWTAELPSTAVQPKVELRQDSGSIDVLVDGKPFTSYVFQIDPVKPLAAKGVLLTKPVLFPLRTPSGITVTRGWPFEKIEGESPDHPHHMGLFFTYDQPDGNRFWNNSQQPLPAIKHVQAEITTDATGNPALATVMHWIGKDNNTLLVEKRLTSFIAGRDQHIIDFDIELKAVADTVEFGATKEGMFAIRLAQWLTESGGTGAYLSNNGDEKERGVWGKRAEWMRIQGEHDGATVGIAILNHPTSTNYPTYWHARGYGAFAANPLGQYAFEKSRKVENPQPFNLTLKKGETALFKFRVILYDGPRTKQELDNEFREYTR